MRRSDREITDISQIKAFIQKESIMRIGLYDEGEVYIVPVNYGYDFENDKHVFYFHGAKAGRKYELAKKSGPEHDQTFTVYVVLNDKRFGPASAKSKKEAEQIAAKMALESLR